MDGKVIIGTELDTSMMDKQIDLLQDKLKDLEEDYAILEGEKPFEGQADELIKLGREIDTTKKKLSKLNQEKEKMTATGFSGMSVQLDGVGKSLKNITKKVVKWGLAVFSVRSAYMFIRNSINTIAGDDDQLKADIDYIKKALAYTIEPVVRWIVELAKKLLFYVGYIIKAWTGKNIFENANKSLGNANKQAKQLSKTLAGFDEMNVLQDTSSGESGTTMPSFDLSQMQGEVPKWLQWIVDNKDEIIGVLIGIGTALGLMKLSDVASHLGLINDKLSTLQGLGIVVLVTSLYEIMVKLKDIWDKFDTSVENNNTTLKDWGGVIEWIGIGVLGLAMIIGGLPITVAGAITLITGLIMKNWEEIKKFFGEKVFGWLDQQIEKLQKSTIGKFFAGFLETTKIKIAQVILFFDDFFNRIKRLFDGITKVFKGETSGWKDIFGAILNGIIGKLNGLIDGINSIISKGSDLLNGLGKIFGANWNINARIPHIPYLAKGGIVNMPGRGVPVGNAIAGERGAEGVIPLTDSQQMALLGEAIGKYITVNLTNINKMNGRVISREMQRVENESAFAGNW